MDRPQVLQRQQLPVPTDGETLRLQRGALQIVLERARSGVTLVTSDGSRSRRWFLGLPRQGRLELAVQAPEHRVRVQLRDGVRLAPRGRVRGYVLVPLPLRLWWIGGRGNGHGDPLLDVLPSELTTAWLGEGPQGGYVHETTSPFFAEPTPHQADAAALVPIVIRNAGEQVAAPSELMVSLRERDLRVMRSRIVAAARRIVLDAEGKEREQVRPFAGKQGKQW